MGNSSDFRGRVRTVVRIVAAALLASSATLAVAADVTVGPGETLWAVAKRLKPWEQGASTEQMAWALFRANPQAFDGTPGRIKRGVTLKVPDMAFVKAVPRADAHGYVTGRKPLPRAGSAPSTVAAAPRKPATPARTTADPLDAILMNPELAAGSSITTVPLANASFERSADARSLAPLVQGGRVDELYQRLAALEERYAGDANFDHLYGSAAHDTGRFSEAVFILQRTVAARPKFAGARMELARAYYALGDNESARREFETLQAMSPPPETARVIADYLAAIDRRAAVYQPQQSLYADVATGYDSNANGAPDTQSFLGIPLDGRNQSTESGFYSLGLGASASYPFAPEWRVLGDGAVAHRGYPDATFVNSEVARLGAGLEWQPGGVRLSLMPNGTYVQLDGEENHQTVGADFAAIVGVQEWQLSLNTRYSQMRFADEALQIQDVDTLLFGLASSHTWLTMPRVNLGAAVTAGSDDAVETGGAFSFGRDLLGVRATGALDLGRGHAVSLSLISLESDYEGTWFGLFPRQDEQYSATLGYEWSAYRARGWIAQTQLTWIDNRSTVPIYDYTRANFGLSVRKEFR